MVLSPGSAGARVHHNLIQHNDFGIDLASVGGATTRVNHNCVRDNTWGMASQRADFVGGKVDHNDTFRHRYFGYGVGDVASTRDSVFANNVSRDDDLDPSFGAAFYVVNSSNISIANNDIHPKTTGILSLGGSSDLRITGNRIEGG